jgi:hypothetical protein
VNVRVVRESEDRLERQVWSWWVETGSSVRGTLRSYVRGRRPTKRHRRWEAIGWWGWFAYEWQGSGVKLQRVDVPVPRDVREEAHDLVVAAIDMEGRLWHHRPHGPDTTATSSGTTR